MTMRTSKPILSVRWLPALALFGVLVLPGSARAGFEITYVFTDDDGTPAPEQPLTPGDMSTYSNQASCQCGHTWAARVRLDDTTDPAIPPDAEVRTYVGASCDLGQAGTNPQASPCVELHAGLASDYADDGLLLPFEQVWVSSRVQGLDMQSVDAAEPRLPCNPDQNGSGGIWVCVESNGEPECQADEMVVKGNSSVNGGASSIQYDHVPPLSTVTGFEVEPGEGAVLVSWDRSELPDISGFRVLCADMDGNPAMTAATEITEAPTGRARTNGQLYYTAQNLCGDEAVYSPEPVLADTPFAGLDWRYVCSDHVAVTASSVHVDGLDGDEEYQLVVVAYDHAGNPRVVSDVLTATPTSDGASGCRIGASTPIGAGLGVGLLLLLGLVRRRGVLRPGAR